MGGHDKRCMMDARTRGQRPISACHQAPSIALGTHGAAEKLARALDRAFGKLDDPRSDHKLAWTNDAQPANPSREGTQ
jgi:hypothetical protein